MLSTTTVGLTLAAGVILILFSALLPKRKPVEVEAVEEPVVPQPETIFDQSKQRLLRQIAEDQKKKKKAEEKMADVFRMSKGKMSVQDFRTKWGDV